LIPLDTFRGGKYEIGKISGDLLIEEFALWDSAMQAQQIGLA
jgi:hypothetical protein